jgi:ABC-2 type transport system permease protein
MILKRAVRKILSLFWRDLAVARSYRAVFVVQFFSILFGVASFYYLSRFIENSDLRRALPQGGTYFGFVLIGVAFFDYLGVALNAFDESLAEARQNGTLEYLLVTQTSLPVILVGSVVYPFVLLSLRTAVYLAWGIVVFGFPVRQANWLGAAIVLASSVLGFIGLGVLSASYTLVFKRGNPVKWFFLGLAGLVSGVMYPVSVLPASLRWAARLIPVTCSLEAMRQAMLGHAPLTVLWPSIRALLLFAIVLLPASLAAFTWALRRTKVTGTLVHF